VQLFAERRTMQASTNISLDLIIFSTV